MNDDARKSLIQTLSPLDGRYRDKVSSIRDLFSEEGMTALRVQVEVLYFQHLIKVLFDNNKLLTPLDTEHHNQLWEISHNIDMGRIKDIEKKTKHDVKAIEYYVVEECKKRGIPNHHLVHFGLTSQDVVDTANSLAIQQVKSHMLGQINKIKSGMSELVDETPILSRTHGQPATPTTIGNVFRYYLYRLDINPFPYLLDCKFGGSVGTLATHYIVYPHIMWDKFMNNFIASLGLERAQITTQVNGSDRKAAIFHGLIRYNNILIDLCRDLWQYISYGYFKAKRTKDHVGSSVMAHKMQNPIEFENAEGNLEMCNSHLNFLADKITKSRLQRDLTDSTVMRNVGLYMSYGSLAYESINKGLSLLSVNHDRIAEDLDNNYQVLSEIVQNILRIEYGNSVFAFNTVKRIFAVDKMTHEQYHIAIKSLEIDNPKITDMLLNLHPKDIAYSQQ